MSAVEPNPFLRPHIIAGERTLITDVQPPAAYHRVHPAWPALIGNAEPALLAVARWRRFNQAQDVALTQVVKVAIGVCPGAFADAAGPPDHLAAGKLQAGQDRIV